MEKLLISMPKINQVVRVQMEDRPSHDVTVADGQGATCDLVD